MEMGEKASDRKSVDQVLWKFAVGEAASRWDNGYRGRLSWT
jgi:hypothetical protein